MGFTIALFVLLVMGALAFILSPVLSRRQDRRDPVQGERDGLLKEKRAVLALLKDLEFDYRTGKILEADYRVSRADAERRAMAVLRRLDELEKRQDVAV